METKHYNIFRTIKTNRPVNPNHVTRLAESIEKHGYFNSKPITVNASMEIIDGQHRFEACKQLGIAIKYEIDNVDKDKSMVALNSTQSNWSLYEYINHYSKKGDLKFTELKNFIDNSGFPLSTAIALYGNDSIKGKDIRSGLMKHKNINLTAVVDLIGFFKGKVKFYNTHKFACAITTLLNRKDVTPKHIEKLKLNAFTISECANRKQYGVQFEKMLKIKKQD